MNWLWAVLVGLVLGVVARALIPGRQHIPLWLTIILGMIGGALGNWLATGIGVRYTGGVDWIRHVLQLVGAIAVVAVGSRCWASIRGRRHPQP
ncbi:GlsB/YeaQ/YmgE family stress response membrane protein [Streptomyces sp. NPDC059740]|uniref:GlsB/YeaQ/YmgE family stress response membrane protein n=1 Tax=Streptomyces sp. NPDC059740 TaxID=3346926 RepID=UPI00364BA74D